MQSVYNECFKEVQTLLKDDKLYISIDSTTDSVGRDVAACIIGSLNNPEYGPFLINLEDIGKGTADELYLFFIRTLKLLYEGTGIILNCR